MTAKEMFKLAGYNQYANNSRYICYTADKENDWKRVKFKLRENKLTIHSDVKMELLRAIIKQCEELGWLE